MNEVYIICDNDKEVEIFMNYCEFKNLLKHYCEGKRIFRISKGDVLGKYSIDSYTIPSKSFKDFMIENKMIAIEAIANNNQHNLGAIEYLKSIGGINHNGFNGIVYDKEDGYYFIEENGCITIARNIPNYYYIIEMEETKEIKITIPEGYEIDKENSTFECIKFKPKELSYKDVKKELFKNKSYYMSSIGSSIRNYCPHDDDDENIMTSDKQVEKLVAINKLLNVAKYLNGDWEPNFNDLNDKYYFIVNRNKIALDVCCSINMNLVYFKTKELAQKAVNILGEDVIRLALSTDY